MKTILKITLIVIAILLAWGCRTKNVTIEHTETSIKGRDIHTYTIDGCEYIGYVEGANCDFLTHKGNCKYCLERNNVKITQPQ